MRTLAAMRLLCLTFTVSQLPAFAGNTVLTMANIPTCSDSINRAWAQATTHQLGAAARDQTGDLIGTRALWEDDPWPNPDDETYRPLSAVKRTFCGTLGRYSFYDSSWSDEADWNLVLKPTPAFTPMLTQAIKGGAREIQDCAGGKDNCVEAEITPDQRLFGNPYFPRSGPSPLVGRTICVHGPWVGDFGHGRRPEIHPSEILWWKQTLAGREWTSVLMVQDDSNRFDRPSRGEWYFKTTSSSTPGWRPWSAPAREQEVRFPFKAGIGLPVYQFDIHQGVALNVTTASSPEAFIDSDDGKHHALEVDGHVVLTAEEFQAVDDDLGVTFADVCRYGSVLRGFVKIAARFGINDNGREGYLELTVGKREVQSLPYLPPNRPPVVAYDGPVMQPPAGGLAVTPGPRGTGPIADLAFEILAGEPGSVADRTVVSIDRIDASGQRSPVEFQITERPEEGVATAGVLRDLPMIPGWTLEITAASGRVHTQTDEGHTLAGWVTDQSTYAMPAGSPLWETFAAAAGGRVGLAPGSVAGAGELRLSLDAGYVPVRSNDAQPEEGTSAARALNLVLGEADPAGRIALFGSAHPVNASWTVSAKNLTLGRAVPVLQTLEPEPGTLGYEVVIGNAPELDGVRIIVPAASVGELFEIEVTAALLDPFGTRGEAKATVWSHALLPEQGGDALLAAVAEMQGLAAPELLSASKLDLDESELSPELDSYREAARGVRMAAEAANEDGVVTVAELREVLAALAAYAELLPPTA